MLRRVNPLPSSRSVFTTFLAVFASESVAPLTNFRRNQGAVCLTRLAAVAAALCLCAAGAHASTWTVDTLNDDSTTTSAAAQTNCQAGNSNTCALRDAILAASADDTIDFSVTGTITLTSTLPAINIALTITGPGANQLTISGAGTYQAMTIGNSAAPTVSISGVTIANGKSTTSGGGGIQLGQGTLTIANCAFAGNSSSHGGGAISSSGSLSVISSTFSNNSATSSTGGGAIASVGPATVTDSTFSSNSAGGGGAISNVNSGALTAVNNTFAGNSAQDGGAILNETPTATLTASNSIFSGNTSTSGGAGIDNTSNATANASYNVYYNNLTGGSEDDCDGCNTNTNATSATANPLALPLGWYGGTTETFLLQPGSQAICTGSASLASAAGLSGANALDQRGFALNPGSNNSCASGSVDAGSVQTNYIQVTNNADAGAGAGDCPGTGTSCTLRDAVGIANSSAPPEVFGDIDFGSAVSPITLASTLSLTATTGINIVGPGASKLTVNGGGSTSNFSVVTLDTGVPALLYGLTISNGNTSTNGGGIDNSGELTLLDDAVSGNTAGNGGGIANGVGSLTIEDSTISGNTASLAGGGILNEAPATLVESTVSGNSTSAAAGSEGGGIFSTSSLNIVGSTIAGNAQKDGAGVSAGGIGMDGGSLTLANAIVAGNTDATTNAANIEGTFTNNGGNVIGGASNSTTSEVNGTGAAITLSTLQLVGAGDTVPVQIPLPPSAAICAGTTGNVPSGITLDQRGEPNSNTTYPGFSTTPCVDAGSVQTNYSMSFATTNPVTPPADVTIDEGFGATVDLDESGNLFSAGTATIPLTVSSGTLSGATPPVGTSAGVAAYSGLSATLGSDLTLSATLSLNAALTTPLSLSATSTPFDVNQAPTTATITVPSVATTSTVDQPVTITASISPNVTNPVNAADIVAMTGSVTFANNGTALTCGSSTFTYANGTATATCIISSLQAGTYSNITATYSGDTNYRPSPASGAAPAITVNPANTTVTMGTTVTPSSPTADQTIAVSATVSPASGSAVVQFSKSSMKFLNNGVAITSCSSQPVNAATGAASCTISSGLPASTTAYNITAEYNSGDPNYNPSAASTPALPVSVGKAATAISVSPAMQTSSVDGSVSFTATVSPNVTTDFVGTANVDSMAGSVTFLDGGSAISGTGCTGQTVTFNPASGTATAICTTTALTASASAQSITATYSGTSDPNYSTSPASTAVTATVSQANITVSVNSNPAPPLTVGQSVTFTATLTFPLPFTVARATAGAVDFSGDGITTCASQPLTAGGSSNVFTASCSISSLTGGSQAIVATYIDDPNYAGTGSTSDNVGLASTTTTVSSAPNPSTTNASVTFTASVQGETQEPVTGSVAISAGSTSLGNCSLGPPNSSGLAMCTLSNATTASLSVGSYAVTATYGGNTNYSGSSGTGPQQVVSKAQPTISVASTTSSSSMVNAAVTFQATMTFPSGTTTPTGTVQFTDLAPGAATATLITACTNPAGLTLMGTAGQTSTYTASCATSSLILGSHTITATFSGDSGFLGATAAATQTVTTAGTTTALTALTPTSTVDSSVSFQASLSAASGTAAPSGKVQFTDLAPGATTATQICTSGFSLTGTSGLNSIYTANCSTSSLVLGTHTISAIYPGDSNFQSSTGSAMQVIKQSATMLSLQTSSSTIYASGMVTFTATVTPNSPILPSGSVVFTDTTTNTALACPAPATISAGGAATCGPLALPSGTDTIQASYAGDSNFIAPASVDTSVAVQDFGLSLSGLTAVNGVYPVYITQGLTNTTDLFTPATITIVPVPIALYSGSLAISCSSTAAAGAPVCTTSNLKVVSSGTQQSAGVTIDATSATPGAYTFTLTATDATNNLTHSLTLEVFVRAIDSTPLAVPSGGVSSGTGNVTFAVPTGVTLSNFTCPFVAGAGIAAIGGVNPSTVGMSCGFGTPSVSGNTMTLAVAVCANDSSTCSATTAANAGFAQPTGKRSAVLIAGVFGLPFFGLVGLLTRKRGRMALYQLLALIAVGVAVLQTMGCGGSFHEVTKTVSGTLPAGTYYILVDGTGSDGNTYEAVLTVDVTIL